MKLLEYSDFGAPQIFVTQPAAIIRPTKNIVRETFINQHLGDQVAACHLIWDIDQWIAHAKLIEQMRESIMANGEPSQS